GRSTDPSSRRWAATKSNIAWRAGSRPSPALRTGRNTPNDGFSTGYWLLTTGYFLPHGSPQLPPSDHLARRTIRHGDYRRRRDRRGHRARRRGAGIFRGPLRAGRFRQGHLVTLDKTR